MPNSINFYEGFFLLVISVHIIIYWFRSTLVSSDFRHYFHRYQAMRNLYSNFENNLLNQESILRESLKKIA